MNIEFKRASELPAGKLLDIWNASFEDYLVNMRMELGLFIRRTAYEDLDLEGSVVMYVDGVPAGMTMNGYRKLGEEWKVWNGGTGIVKSRRGQGLGRPLIEASLNTYKIRGVHTAYLEVFAQNEPAIRLYKSCGYVEFERLRIMEAAEETDYSVFGSNETGLRSKTGVPAEAGALNFYDHSGPWQTQWQCLKEGQSVILFEDNTPLGYALYRNSFDAAGKHVSVVVTNIGLHPEADNPEAVMKELLRVVLKPETDGLKRYANHVRSTRPLLGNMLEKAGFKTTYELLHMKREIEV